MHKVLVAALLLVLFGTAGPLLADQEASNIPYVQAGTYGRCYAKSVPDDHWGDRGVTRLYRVQKEDDQLIASYPWFSQQIYLQCNMSREGEIGASLVRFGPWARGHQASADDLALEFYFNEEPQARYSTLDIAGSPENVEASVSHYVVIEEIIGYRWRSLSDQSRFMFGIKTVDGRTLEFDAATGIAPQ